MRLLIVSNRLPVTVSEQEGALTFNSSAGGLVSGLGAYLDSLKKTSDSALEYLWIGWPGKSVSDQVKDTLKEKLAADYKAYPVFMSEEVMDNFYLGFCNKTIWPLFHYFPGFVSYDENYWQDYKNVNESFCQAVLEVVKDDDVVWIHDYQLMLLPLLLRKIKPELKIGFFLHIPFPSFEIFRLLPASWRTSILEGLLGANLIGFHTHDYTQYFLRCVLRLLGYEHNMGQIIVRERELVKVDTFPMGIDYDRYYNLANDPQVVEQKKILQETIPNLRPILSVDRLDYSKGILNRLQGYETFLEQNPQWQKKIVLILILVPSRTGVDEYQQMKKHIDECVGLINGKFGTMAWTPVIYQYKFLSSAELATFYKASDVALVTPLRDGMNLIAKEYIASRTDQSGTLILSEMAGAAHELGEAIIINPTTRKEIADALKTALEMPLEEQIKRNQVMQERLKHNNVIHWAEDFIKKIDEVCKQQEKFNAKVLKPDSIEKLIKQYRKARHKVLFLDYDGTLVPFSPFPENTVPGQNLLNTLQKISEDSNTEIVIISGRSRLLLERWFDQIPIHLIAEHGVWIREKGTHWQLIKNLRSDWKVQILPILKLFADRLPGAFVEEKEYSLVLHYRKADPDLAALREKELIDDLVHFTANIDVQVLQGHKVVEIKNAGISKGNAALHFLSGKNCDFIFVIGDDNTDEELFMTLSKQAYSVRVGLTSTHAKFNLPSYRDANYLLKQFSEVQLK